ncbi:MAG: hypothetical protein ACJ8F7_10435 [Gemmataceae bacterium]
MRRFCCRGILLTTFALVVSGSTALAQAPATPPPPEEKKDPAPADPHSQLMETVGLLSGLYLYQSYLNIGLLADGKAEKIYDEKAARSVLGSVLTPLAAVEEKLAQLTKLARTQADRDAVENLRAVVVLLRQQGKELTAFWDSARPEDGAKYEATRKEAWKQISAMLGLDKK